MVRFLLYGTGGKLDGIPEDHRDALIQDIG
jgi:hypothetical protein